MKTYCVGISGGSASGKTYLLEQLVASFQPAEITLVSQDNYYKELEEQERDEAGNVNFDHPSAVRLDTLARDIRRLKSGESVQVLEYHFNNPNKERHLLTYEPAALLVIEGLFVFYHPEVARELDLKVFVEAQEHIKLVRRIRRDFNDRGYAVDSILQQYEEYTMPMYQQFVAPYREESDLVLLNNSHFNKGIDVLVHHLRYQLCAVQAAQ
jgi:uridine kinase